MFLAFSDFKPLFSFRTSYSSCFKLDSRLEICCNLELGLDWPPTVVFVMFVMSLMPKIVELCIEF